MSSNLHSPPGPSGRPPFAYRLPGILLIVALYALLHAATRLLASGNMGEDDPLDNLLIQTLAPGYSLQVGPLYDWALWLLQKLLGSGIEAFLALKYICLIAISGLLFTLTRRITDSALWAFIAVESLATVYQVFWRFHEGFTHRVGAMLLIIATLWAATLILERGKWRDYLLFATLTGLGLLSEHIYLFFLAALFAASALQPGMRRRLFSLRLLTFLPLTGLIIAPYAHWILAEPARSSAFLAGYLPAIPPYTLPGLVASLRDAVTFPMIVLAPYAIILPLVFPAILRPRKAASDNELQQLLGKLLGLEFLGQILFNGLLFARASYPVHSILPAALIALIWLTERARATAPSNFRVRIFVVILIGFTVTAYLVRCGNMFIYEPFCSRCRWGIPYAELAGSLRAGGFERGTLVTNNDQVGANLRRFFPDSHIVLSGISPQPTANTEAAPNALAIIWSPNEQGPEIPPELLPYLAARTLITGPEVARIPWKHLWRPLGYRNSEWAWAIAEKQH